MRLMTYNIWDGGGKRLKKIIDVVSRTKPDVLVLNEANNFEKNNSKILKMFAKKTNLNNYHLELGGDGWGYNVAILSRFEISSISVIKPVSRAIIIAKIKGKTKEVTVVGLHLYPFAEKERLKEIKKLIQKLKTVNNSVIILGDFNSLSTLDKYTSDSISDRFLVNNKITYDVQKELDKAGFNDIATNSDKTYPTKVGESEHSPVRIDRILVSKDLKNKVKKYSVIKTNLTTVASDHYPIFADIDV